MKPGHARRTVMAAMLVVSLITIGNAQPVCNVLLNFGGGADGSYPQAGLIADGNRLYGTILSDGNYGYGAVFGMDIDGPNFAFLYSFTGLPYWIHGTNTDGAYPFSDLVLSGDSLYGTAWIGGFSDLGTVFKVGTNGLTFTNLFNFSGTSDGSYPFAGFVLAGNTLYGTTSSGGSSGNGAVFAIRTDGSGYTNLYNFSPLDPMSQTNIDGANSRAQLVLSPPCQSGLPSFHFGATS